MNTKHLLALTVVLTLLGGCGRKEEPPSIAKVSEFVCAYAPSQSKSVLALSSMAGGAGAGAAAVANAAGLTAVAHSSGAYIFTGAAGYIAGTIGTAAIVPVAVTIGAFAGGAAGTIELACAPKNHPGLVSKVTAYAEEVASRVR